MEGRKRERESSKRVLPYLQPRHRRVAHFAESQLVEHIDKGGVLLAPDVLEDDVDKVQVAPGGRLKDKGA